MQNKEPAKPQVLEQKSQTIPIMNRYTMPYLSLPVSSAVSNRQQSSMSTALTTASAATSAIKNVPAFLNKLYNMVNDSTTDNMIKWSLDGRSFIVEKHEDFSKEVLPKFFKHNNFSSFVRQLNMYGFHKIPHLQQGVMSSDADHEVWEFSNANFQKGQPDLLCLVSRKKAKNDDDKQDTSNLDLGGVISDITAIKRHQLTISTDLRNIQQENQLLWQECIGIRNRYQKQQDTVNKIVRFLASVLPQHTTKQANVFPVSEDLPISSLVPQKRRFIFGEDELNSANNNSQDRSQKLLLPPPASTAALDHSEKFKFLENAANDLNNDIDVLENHLKNMAQNKVFDTSLIGDLDIDAFFDSEGMYGGQQMDTNSIIHKSLSDPTPKISAPSSFFKDVNVEEQDDDWKLETFFLTENME